MSFGRLFAALIVGTTAIHTSPAIAAPILTETDASFSSSWTAPTAVGSGITGIAGSGSSGKTSNERFDTFQFSGLTPGATSIVFNFSLAPGYNLGNYANGGGSIYYSYVPFTGAYYVDQGNGKVLGSHNLLASNFDVTHNPWQTETNTNRGSSSYILNLGDDFTGNLYLALDFTYGNQVNYNISSPSWASGSTPVARQPDLAIIVPEATMPLPATVWLFLAGLLTLAGRKVVARSRSSVRKTV